MLRTRMARAHHHHGYRLHACGAAQVLYA